MSNDAFLTIGLFYEGIEITTGFQLMLWRFVISADVSLIVECICFLKPATTAIVITITVMLTATAKVAMRTIVFCVEEVDSEVRWAMNSGRFMGLIQNFILLVLPSPKTF